MLSEMKRNSAVSRTSLFHRMDSAQSLMDTTVNMSPLSDVEEEFEEKIMEEEVSLLTYQI